MQPTVGTTYIYPSSREGGLNCKLDKQPYIHLLIQAKELDVVSDLTVESSENVREGNEQVRGVSYESSSSTVCMCYCT